MTPPHSPSMLCMGQGRDCPPFYVAGTGAFSRVCTALLANAALPHLCVRMRRGAPTRSYLLSPFNLHLPCRHARAPCRDMVPSKKARAWHEPTPPGLHELSAFHLWTSLVCSVSHLDTFHWLNSTRTFPYLCRQHSLPGNDHLGAFVTRVRAVDTCLAAHAASPHYGRH